MGTGLGVSIILLAAIGIQRIWMWSEIRRVVRTETSETREGAVDIFDELEKATMESYAIVSLKYFDEYFANIRKQTRVISNLLKSERTDGELQMIMKQMVLYDKKHPDWLALYIIKDDGSIMGHRGEIYTGGSVDLRNEKWYKRAKRRYLKHKKPKYYWSDIVDGKLSSEKKVICACPYRDREGNFQGVVAASVDVMSFRDLVDKFDDEERTAIGIFDRNGEAIAKSHDFKDFDKSSEYIGNSYREYGEFGFQSFTMDEAKWTICLEQSLVEQERMEQDIQSKFEGFIDHIVVATVKSNVYGLIAISILLIFSIGIMNYISIRLSQTLIRPLRKMVDQVESFGENNDFAKVDVETNDEIGQLGLAFNRMVEKLKDYLEHIRVISGENERMESERSLVRQIQQNMLPNVFPAFPDRKELDIYASLLPAREGGGSFYDFFFIDSKTFCISIGEASGNGLLSTMFALVAKTVIKSYALQGFGTDRILAEANNQIAYGNNEGIVADVFVGIIHLSSGEMEYSMAGEAPVQWKHSGEAPVALADLNGVTLGNMENVPYQKKRVLLSQGDLLFAYTKDTPECVDRHGSIYTAEYLYEKYAELSANDYKINTILDALNDDIKAYTEGTKRKEDATMLMLRFWG